MYPCGSAISFHGIMMIPITPVMNPPTRKLITLGQTWAKSFAGLTTLAAMFVASVAMQMEIIAIESVSLFSNLLSNTIGSQMAWPEMAIVALVTATPMKE